VVTFNLALCALAVATCAACMVLLFRGYARSRRRLLLWSGVCFVFLTLNNVALFLDLVVLEQDLRPWRHAAAALGLVFMIVGLVFESE
jgi:Family of unknown function (DUF5985)